LLQAEQYAAAAAALQRSLAAGWVPEKNAAAHFFLAGALEMDGQTDAALAAARRAAELQPDSPRSASRPAWIEYHAKRYDAARASYQALLARFDSGQEPAEVREVMRDTRMVLSNIAVQQNQLAAAEEWIEQVLDEFPDNVGAMNDLGYLWVDQNKHLERATRMIERAVAAEPKNTAYRDSLGWAYYRLGRFAEAVTELRLAVAEDEPHGVVLDHLGDALHQSGDLAAAVEAWTRAVEALRREQEPEKAAAVQSKIEQAPRRTE
jgi:tetratricopeptide (TPR) repeat protein